MTNDNSPTQAQNDNTPVHVADSGRVRASVWQSVVDNTPQYKITISRSYKRDNSWHRGHSYYPEELPAVVEVAARAQRWIDRRKRDAQIQPLLVPA